MTATTFPPRRRGHRHRARQRSGWLPVGRRAPRARVELLESSGRHRAERPGKSPRRPSPCRPAWRGLRQRPPPGRCRSRLPCGLRPGGLPPPRRRAPALRIRLITVIHGCDQETPRRKEGDRAEGSAQNAVPRFGTAATIRAVSLFRLLGLRAPWLLFGERCDDIARDDASGRCRFLEGSHAPQTIRHHPQLLAMTRNVHWLRAYAARPRCWGQAHGESGSPEGSTQCCTSWRRATRSRSKPFRLSGRWPLAAQQQP